MVVAISSVGGESPPPPGTPAGARTDPGAAGEQVTLIIWRDWKGDLYAFCGRKCQRHYAAWVSDPNYPFEKATWSDVSFGCWWCGGDLARGVVWLSPEQLAGSEPVQS
jgi:hypothetical protein